MLLKNRIISSTLLNLIKEIKKKNHNSKWNNNTILCLISAYAFAELIDNALSATSSNVGPRNIELRLVSLLSMLDHVTVSAHKLIKCSFFVLDLNVY